MGIKHLKTLVTTKCQKTGVYHFQTVNNFLKSEKIRMYKENIVAGQINNPIKQMELKKTIENKPYIVAIDAYLYAVRYKRIFKKIEYGFLTQILLSLSAGILPIYVFDGIAPDEKKKTINSRKQKKQKNCTKLEKLMTLNNETAINSVSKLSLDELVIHINTICNKLDDTCDINNNGLINNIDNVDDMVTNDTINNMPSYLLYDTNDTSEKYNELVKLTKKTVGIEYIDIQNLKIFLDLLKIPHITANKEADDMMAFLYKEKIINACQSDDMDMLPKGCGNIIQITGKGVVTQFLLLEILKEMNLEYGQFVDMCILLGSDYYTVYLPKIRPIELYNMFLSDPNPSIETFVLNYFATDPKIISHLEQYQKVRNSFLVSTEKFTERIHSYQISLLNGDIIIDYLEKIGIRLDACQNKIIRKKTKDVNLSISKLLPINLITK